MRIHPDGAALLATAADVLKQEILPDVPADKAYALRMVINAMSIARRQLETGDHAETIEYETLAIVLDSDQNAETLNRAFARLVRRGDAASDENLQQLLWAQTLNKARESAPRYLQQENIET